MRSTRSQATAKKLETYDLRDITRAVSIVLYGRSGTGKTTFAATAPKPTLYLDIRDEGTDSISDVKGIRGMSIESLEELEDVYWYLVKNTKEFKSVVLDTVTQLQTIVVAEVMQKNKRKGEPGAWGTMRKQDWGDVSAMMKEVLTRFRDLTSKGINVIFIAQDRTFNLSDEEESNAEMLAPEVGPALSPSIARTLNAACTVVANTFIRERETKKEVKGKIVKKKVIEYCVGVGPSPLYTRKVRKPKTSDMPEVIADCEFGDIVDIIKGTK